MGTNNANTVIPNITPQAMAVEKEHSEGRENAQTQEGSGEDYKKNYLDVKLSEGQKSKTLRIRMLPMDMNPASQTYGTPFVHVYIHNVRVPNEISARGWRNYLCLSRTRGLDAKYGHQCPFCEINKNAYELGKNEKDTVKQKEWYKLSTSNLPREAVIVRCIDRDHEDEGVKFWKFNLRDDKTDPYNQIMNLWEMRSAEGAQYGQNINILDIYNGVDLTITITEGNAAPQITDGRINCPVSTNEEQLRAWLYDEKQWQEVFPAKTYEYLKLVSAMRIPWKDKDSGMWVDKEEFLANRNRANASFSQQMQTADAMMYKESGDLVSALSINDSDIPM